MEPTFPPQPPSPVVPLDRAAFKIYFLGSLVPLVALGVVVEHYALPRMRDGADAAWLLAIVGFVGMLSLGAFAMLRAIMRGALERMKRDNRRLKGLLHVSTALGAAQHVTEALTSACREAQSLAHADAAFVFLKGDEDDAPSLASQHGDAAESLYASHAGAIEELMRTAVESARPALRDGDPAVVAVPLPIDASARGALAVLRRSGRFDADEVDALSTLAGLAAVAFQNADLRDAQRNFFSHVTDMLVTALDSHLGFHHGHGQRVAQLANRLGRAVGLDDASLQRLHFASLLHDIGMLKLDRDQHMTRSVFDKHTLWGYRMLARIRLWKDSAPIVYQHHEWYDGSGYPEGKSGDAIALEARILSVCDAVDSMTAETSYRSPMSLEKALAELARCSGTQFDPALVEVFRGLARDGLIEIGPPPAV